MEEQWKRLEKVEQRTRKHEEEKEEMMMQLEELKRRIGLIEGEKRELWERMECSEARCRKLESEKEDMRKSFYDVQKICLSVEPDKVRQRQIEATTKINSLEQRVLKLEEAVKEAFDSMIPQVEALLRKMERNSAPNSAPPAFPTCGSGPFQVPPMKRPINNCIANSVPSKPQSEPSNIFSKPLISPSSTCKKQPHGRPDVPSSTYFSSGLDKTLFRAAREGRIDDVRCLLAAGVSSNAHYEGITALQAATEMNRLEVVHLLLENGADPNFTRCSEVNSPLTIAIIKGFGSIVSLLIQHGADVNKREADGTTPLHYAAYWGRNELFGLLVEAGADPSTMDYHGRTPLDVSVSKKKTNKKK